MARIAYLTKIEFGPGALSTLPEAVAELGISRPFLVTDHGIAASGLLARVAASLPAGTPRFLDDAAEPDREGGPRGARGLSG